MSGWPELAETLALVASVIGSAAGASYWLGRRLARLEEAVRGVVKQLVRLEERMNSTEARITQLEKTAVELGGRISNTERLLSQLGERVGSVEERLSALREELAEFKAGATARFDRLEERIERKARTARSANEFFVDLLGYEGVLKPEAATFAKSELLRIFELAANPLTREEWQRLKQLLEKDDLTLEEAQELYRIADKLVEEHGDRIEAWKILWYSRAWIGINWRRMAEQRKKAEQKSG